MTRIGLHDGDGWKFPNLALMKLAAWHRSQGHEAARWSAIEVWEKVYASRVFTWSSRDPHLPAHTVEGGTGTGSAAQLLQDVEHICPDYSLYGLDYGLGFLTRGCPRRCPWCFVPEKEGQITEHAEFGEFRHPRTDDLVLLDNNILAHPHGIAQIEAMAAAGMRVDFNQGLDARLLDDAAARLLARLRWRAPLRLGCDTTALLPAVRAAVEAARRHFPRALTKSNVMVYVLVRDDLDDALERVEALRELNVSPFAQPVRGRTGEPPRQVRDFARWVNHKATFHRVPWSGYKASRAGRGTAQPGQLSMYEATP